MKKWSFDRDKKILYEVVGNRDGRWCYLCGKPYNLSLHHIESRGRTAPNQIIHKAGKEFYRDDPLNLVMLCSGCHDWVQQNMEKAEKFFRDFPKNI